MTEIEFREKLADLCHRQWSGWMQYLFSKTVEVGDGCEEIPRESVDRWRREALELMDPRVSLLGLGAMPHFIWSDHDRRSAQDFDPSFDSDIDHLQCSVYEHADQHQLAPEATIACGTIDVGCLRLAALRR